MDLNRPCVFPSPWALTTVPNLDSHGRPGPCRSFRVHNDSGCHINSLGATDKDSNNNKCCETSNQRQSSSSPRASLVRTWRLQGTPTGCTAQTLWGSLRRDQRSPLSHFSDLTRVSTAERSNVLRGRRTHSALETSHLQRRRRLPPPSWPLHPSQLRSSGHHTHDSCRRAGSSGDTQRTSRTLLKPREPPLPASQLSKSRSSFLTILPPHRLPPKALYHSSHHTKTSSSVRALRQPRHWVGAVTRKISRVPTRESG